MMMLLAPICSQFDDMLRACTTTRDRPNEYKNVYNSINNVKNGVIIK